MNVAGVYPKVRQIVADVLVLDEDEVSLNSRLIGDLGAESIDFLDLCRSLWKTTIYRRVRESFHDVIF